MIRGARRPAVSTANDPDQRRVVAAWPVMIGGGCDTSAGPRRVGGDRDEPISGSIASIGAFVVVVALAPPDPDPVIESPLWVVDRSDRRSDNQGQDPLDHEQVLALIRPAADIRLTRRAMRERVPDHPPEILHEQPVANVAPITVSRYTDSTAPAARTP